MAKEQEVITQLFEKGVLVHKDFLSRPAEEFLLDRLENEADIIVLNSDYAQVLAQPTALVDWYELDRSRVEAEKERDDDLYQRHLQEFQRSSLHLTSSGTGAVTLEKQEFSSLEVELQKGPPELELSLQKNPLQVQPESGISFSGGSISRGSDGTGGLSIPSLLLSSGVNVVLSYHNIPKKYEVKDFTSFFITRYHYLEKLLRNRQELQDILTINRVLGASGKEKISIIGVVAEIVQTKAGNLMLTVEDLTGQIKVIITKSKQELFQEAKELVVDEVIGISGMAREKIIFADALVWPDIPVRELKKKEEDEGGGEEYAAFLSDIHVGSALFLKEEFEHFLQWINGEAGNQEQRELARKVKYVFMVGDLVDGVGIYPAQEPELEIKDIHRQYVEFTNLVKRIPSTKQIIMCPGNHDAVHIAEPQPALTKELAGELLLLPNVTIVTNPAMVNIAKTENFSGFDVLMYHGYSFDYYVANVESIRNGGGYQRADLIMKFLLKRRHLAPSFKSTPYFPGHAEDPLLIKRVPDFFVTGHIHYSSVANYKGVTMISCSCWQGKTTFQEKLGHKPEPARLPLVNLKTREIKVLRFG